MFIVISAILCAHSSISGSLKYGPQAKSGPRIDFVNDEKLIDENRFDF